jgi:hypothetical protein
VGRSSTKGGVEGRGNKAARQPRAQLRQQNDINGAIHNSRNHKKKMCKSLKRQCFSPKNGRFFPEVLKKFPKLPYSVVAKELYNQEQRVVD